MEAVIASMRTAAKEINATDDFGTMEMLSSTLMRHEKLAWELRAHLGR